MLTLIALGLTAHAFAPDDTVHIGGEPARVYRYHTEVQRRLRHADAWQQFTSAEGEGWMARFDERTGTALRAWGAGIDLGPLGSEEAVERSLTQLLAKHPGLSQVPVSSLRLGRAHHDQSTDSWIVRFDQVAAGSNRAQGADLSRFEHFSSHGQPVVWRGAVHAKIRFGKLVQLGFQTYPEVEGMNTQPTLTAQQAVQRALQTGPHPEAEHTVEGAVLTVLPVQNKAELTHHLAWMVRTETGAGHNGDVRGQWVHFIDAHTGALLNVHNQVRYFNAEATIDERTVDGTLVDAPLAYLPVTGGGSTDTTDAFGNFDLEGEVSATLNGEHFRVSNNGASPESATWTGDYTWTTEDATQAELDTWVFMHGVRDWALEYAPDVTLVDEKLTSTVNLNSNCNAYYDGNVNYYRAGGGCNNTGRILDVNYHEYGHGFHYYAAYSSYVDGSVGEGSADVLSFLNTGDSRIAPYFGTSGYWIRDQSNDNRYPEDYDPSYVHESGLIFGGSFWDFWGLMTEVVDAEVAYGIVADTYKGTLQQNPEIATSYDDALVADDDNGDLSDGTPNICQLIEAFGNHGLGPLESGASVIELSADTLDNQPSDATEYALDAEIRAVAEDCLDGDVESGQVFYSTDGGASYTTADLSAADDLLSGSIPGVDSASLPAIVQYYIEAETTDGGSITLPPGGPIAPFTFAVGELTEIYCEDFDSGDGGYTHELLSGSNDEGADDWQWGAPQGQSEDPDYAFSGLRVWGNDLGADNYNGAYQANKHNRLQSVSINADGYDRVILQYRRWLNVEDSQFDQARITANDEVIWTNWESSGGDDHTQDRQWVLHTVEVPVSALDADGNVAFGWEIISDGGLEFGGWTLDDVCVYGLESDGRDAEGTDGDSGTDGDDGAGVEPPAGDVGGGEVSACAGCSSNGSGTGGALALVGLAGLALRRRRD